MFYVYIIRSKIDNSLYIGFTSDLRRRLTEHNDHKNKSTKSKAPFELIYYEAYKSMADAKYRENNLKRFSGAYTHLKKRIYNSLETKVSK